MSRLTYIFANILVLVAVASCSRGGNDIATRQGYIDLEVAVDPSFTTSDGTSVLLSASLVPNGDSLSFTLRAADGASFTWPTARAFILSTDTYMAGRYTGYLSGRVSADAPLFSAEQEIMLAPDGSTKVTMTARPADAMLRLSIGKKAGNLTVTAASVHLPGYGYATMSGTDTVLFVAPGELEIYASVTDGQRTVPLAVTCDVAPVAARIYDATVEVDNQTLVLTVDGKVESTLDLSGGLPEGVPQITTSGFTPGQTLEATEGLTIESPLLMTVSSATPLTHVFVNAVSPLLMADGQDFYDADLLHLTAEQREFMNRTGFTFSIDDGARNLVADYTKVVEELASRSSAISRFTMLAQDAAGACSEPVTLTVSTRVVEMRLMSSTPAVVGVDTASVVLAASEDLDEVADFAVRTIGPDGEYSLDCPVTSIADAGTGMVSLEFAVPSGLGDIPVEIYYLGLKRLATVIKRANPAMAVNVDAFATTAILYLGASRTEALPFITEQVRVYVNGNPSSVWYRISEDGLVVINGLTPDTRYDLVLRLVGESAAATARFTTEEASPFPGDIMDYRTTIDYKHLACGGRYSATTVPVVNRQNYTDVVVEWPKKLWTNVNARTFDTASKLLNTWYLQPSAWLTTGRTETSRAICLRSVGYDHDGSQIADYVQTDASAPTPYSIVVPRVADRSAGRAWLGTYSYNHATGAETLSEGEPFTSRPSSLNGFFKYLPDLTDGTDYGVLDIELVSKDAGGKETVVADGHYDFRTSPDYKAFNVPLTYSLVNLRPTHLRVSIRSSHYDDELVPLTPDLRTASLVGSALWLTELSFSY